MAQERAHDCCLQSLDPSLACFLPPSWFHWSFDGRHSHLLLDKDSFMFDLLKPKPVRNLLSTHRSGRQDNHKLLFSLVMLEQWLRSKRNREPLVDTRLP